jgi:hypothetical protein
MPEFLRSWIPIAVEGVESYDHTAAELGVTFPADNLGLATTRATSIPEEEEDNEQVVILKGLLTKMVENETEEAKFLKLKLKETILNIKDEKNINNKNAIDRAKLISTAALVSNKITATNVDMIVKSINIFKSTKKPKRKPGKDKPQD